MKCLIPRVLCDSFYNVNVQVIALNKSRLIPRVLCDSFYNVNVQVIALLK